MAAQQPTRCPSCGAQLATISAQLEQLQSARATSLLVASRTAVPHTRNAREEASAMLEASAILVASQDKSTWRYEMNHGDDGDGVHIEAIGSSAVTPSQSNAPTQHDTGTRAGVVSVKCISGSIGVTSFGACITVDLGHL